MARLNEKCHLSLSSHPSFFDKSINRYGGCDCDCAAAVDILETCMRHLTRHFSCGGW
ncbi:hypothetical protein DL98DRAFT_211013 [Cadophora sp. DSE1049]|nr:hypothetical protein DL98DRAFT_211013 [Cadophora sp. DSE1049]